jgi:hypothetical protein
MRNMLIYAEFSRGKMESEWFLGRLVEGSVEWIQLAQDRD